MFTNNLLPGKILNHWSDSKPAVSLLNATNTVFSRIANTSFLRDKHEEFGTQQNKANTVTESPFKAVEKQSEKLLASEADITNESNEWDNDDWGDSWEDHWGNEDGSQSNISDENAPSVKKSSSDFIQSKSDAFTQLIDSNVRSQPKPETEKSEPKSDDQLLNNDGWNEDWGNEKDTNVALNEAPDEIPDFEPPEPETTLEMISNDLIVHVAEASKCEKEQSEILLSECLIEKVPDNPIMNENGWSDNWASEDVTHSSVSDQILLIEKSSTGSFESKSDASSQLIEDDEHSQPKPEAESKDVETKSENQWDDDWGSEDDTKSNVSDQIVIPKEKSSDLSESKSNASSQLIEDDVHFQPKPEAEKKVVETKFENQCGDDWENEDDTNPSVSVQNSPSANEPSTEFDESKSNASSQLIKNDVHFQPNPEVEGKTVESKSDNNLLNNEDWNDVWGNEEDTNVALNEAPNEILDFEPPEPETTLEMISNDLIVHVAEASKCEKEQSEILLTECLTEKVPDNPIMNESGWNDNWASEDVTHSSVSDQILLIEKSSTGSFESKSDASSQLIEDDEHSQPKPEAESKDVETKSENQWDDDWGSEDDTKSNVSDQIVIPKEKSSDLSESKSDASSQLIEDDEHSQPKPEAESNDVETKSENQWDDDWGNEDDTKSSVPVQIIPSADKPSTGFFGSKSDPSSQLIKNDVHSQPKPDVESKAIGTKSDNQWDDDWGNEDDTKSNVSDQIVILTEKSSNLFESKSDASSQFIEDDVHFQPKPEAEKKDVETKSDNQWDDNWGNEDDTKSSVPVQIISSADKPSTGFFGSKSDPSSQLIKDDVRSQPKPEAEKKAETQSDNQLLNNDDWNDDWGNYDEDSKPNVSALGKSEPTVDSKQMLSKLNTSNNLSTNNVSAQPKLQTSELKEVKAKEDKPILVKKTKSKVTSTAKLFSSSTSTQLKAPVKSKNEWANDDWGNDWDDFEPLTLSDRRSSAQTDLSIDSDWSADWEVKPKPKVQKHPKPSPSTTFPRASKSISDDHFISNQQLKPTPSSSSTSDSQIMNDQQSVMQNQYKPTLSQQQTGEASGASWFSDFRSATRTAALTTVTHAVNRWSFNPTNILDAVGKFILNSPIYFFVILKLNFSTQWKTSVVQLVFLRPKKWQPLCDNSNVKNNTFQLFCRAIVMLLFELILYLYS